ncbi:MAG: hypothetical protein KGJ79_12835 [Alphaproteobacteria bacterium]|nr:hypothetical protein [Alphaproteobacteria bacterium]MDE2494630.1 hypothetical protein [Alphaproteobacteria bacterium]
MENRRTVVFSFAGALAGLTGVSAASQAIPPSAAAADAPKATVIPGKPPVLDFGGGLKVPCSKAAFLTLWEGETFWLTFGAGRSSYSLRANGEAVQYASAAMKLLLMTLAFTPERLARVDGDGWRLKVQDVRNYVRGDIKLPGKPFWPMTDAGMGFGDSDNPDALPPPTPGTPGGSGAPFDMAGSIRQVDAFAAYVVNKQDASLNWVRAHAKVVLAGG